MSRALAIALGGVGVGGALYLAYGWFFGDEGEPATPVPLSPPEPSGGSGIALSPDEVEALARVIASEAGSGAVVEQRAIGWAVRNRFRGGSIYSGKGKSGGEHPWRSQKGSNPPFASSKDATDATRALAREVLAADQAQDPTGGATSFFEPRLQDVAVKAGEMARRGETGSRTIDGVKISDITRFKNYHKDADTIRRDWSKGSAVYATAGRFEFWGSAALLALRGGQARTIAGLIEIRVPRAEDLRRRSAARGLLALGGRR